MKYIKTFNNSADYQAFKGGGDFITPNVSYIKDTEGIKLKPYTPPALAGDVAYWDGSSVKTTPLSSWDSSLGTPVGVVVVPEGFAPDGKIRIISLKVPRVPDGVSVSTVVTMIWGPADIDANLTNYTKVPTTDNAGSTTTGTSLTGYLPSDKLEYFENSEIISFNDPKTKYISSTRTPYIISPYLGEIPNTEYYKEISGGNTLSDFNGLSNTETLVNLSSGYTAANVAWKYKDGASNLQWYLPSMGELGYMMVRFKVINDVIKSLGEWHLGGSNYWSSSEYSKTKSYSLNTTYGLVESAIKNEKQYVVRPFAILD